MDLGSTLTPGTGVLIREKRGRLETDTHRGVKPREDRGRDRSDTAKSQGLPQTPEAGRGAQNSLSCEAPASNQHCPHLDFRLLASGIETGQICVVRRHPMFGGLLGEPLEIIQR